MKRGLILSLATLLDVTYGFHSCWNAQKGRRLNATPTKSGAHVGGRGRCPKLCMATDDDFWAQQREIMSSMADRTDKSLKEEQQEKFAKRRNALIEDAAFFTALIFSFLWLICENPFVSFSYSLGAVLGLAYAYGLAKYVESIGGTVDDAEAVEGAGVGQARFAFLILLFVLVGKFRSVGLIEIPTIAGFFTYQLASLSQGLREIND